MRVALGDNPPCILFASLANPLCLASNQRPALPPGFNPNTDLTPSQLACYNDPACSPTQDLIQLLNQDLTATGAGSLPCGGPDGPTCNPAPASMSWLVVAAAVGLLLVGRS